MYLHDFISTDNIERLRKALAEGADIEERESQFGWTPLTFAVVHCHEGLDIVRLLVDGGADLNASDQSGWTPLRRAITQNAVQCARVLLEAGADTTPHRDAELEKQKLVTLHEFMCIDRTMVEDEREELIHYYAEKLEDYYVVTCPLISWAHSMDMVQLLLEAGEDLQNIRRDMRTELIGIERGGPIMASEDELRASCHPKFGAANPERMDMPFWRVEVRGGEAARQAYEVVDTLGTDRKPFWAYGRFGQSLTPLPDGRFIEIGGEHEDWYDVDYCIYNDVIVHSGTGEFEIFGYPKDVFPPTDSHSATLVGEFIYVIGNIGYAGTQVPGETPVFRLHIQTLRIEKVETTGEKPGWISRHKARLENDEIRIWSGKVIRDAESQYSRDNPSIFYLDLQSMTWRKASND